MSKRRGNQKAVSSKAPKTVSEIVCAVSFILGLGLAALMINIYRVTIISWQTPFYTALIIGIASAIITRNSDYNKQNFPPGSRLLIIFYYIVALGFSFNYVLFATNYYLAYPETHYYEFPIKDKSSMPGGKGHRNEREPLVTFDYFEEEKELVFGYSETAQVEQANKLIISIKKGRFGYDIVSSRQLIK